MSKHCLLPDIIPLKPISNKHIQLIKPPQYSKMYGAVVVALSLVPAALGQSACGLPGFASCTAGTRTTGYGCCPTGYKCLATECAYTGTPTTTAKPTTTACPGVPAHHLCPQSLGGKNLPSSLSQLDCKRAANIGLNGRRLLLQCPRVRSEERLPVHPDPDGARF